ncbi:hypothetical protein COP1_006456 [Malus domestica]
MTYLVQVACNLQSKLRQLTIRLNSLLLCFQPRRLPRFSNLQLRPLHPRTVIASPLQFESRIGTNEMTKIVNCIEGGSSPKLIPTTVRLLQLASFYDSDDSAAEKPIMRSATESAATSVSIQSPARPAASLLSATEPSLPWPSPAPFALFSEST